MSSAPIQAIGPLRPFAGRSGSGVPTSRRSSTRARVRSTAPSARQPASPAASTGTPMKVTSSPAPAVSITIA